MDSAPLFTCVIPVFNKWELTRACLESLRRNTPSADFEVVVVDNASSDATASECLPLGQALFPGRFTSLRFDANRNFGPACNAGAQAAASPLLFFLNNDTLLEPGWLPPLLRELDSDANTGAVGPLLCYPEDPQLGVRVQHLGIAVGPQLYPSHLYEYFPAGHPLVHKRRNVQALSAAALMLPRRLFFDCGAFYEEYRNGGEDIELGLRVGRMGFRQCCVPGSRITHLVGQTLGRHNHEAHNGQVLKARCFSLLVPDLALHAASDGYELGLTSMLLPYFALPQRREQMLGRRLAEGLDAASCAELLQREPLWLAGYTHLARLLESEGDVAGACSQRFLQSRFRPDGESMGELARLARLCGDSKRLATAEAWLAWQQEAAVDLRAAAKEVAWYMEALRQSDVAALYRNWRPGEAGSA